MCGCSSRAVRRISRRKRSGPSACSQLGVQHLERDRPVVLQVAGEVDRGHAAAAELALDAVAVAERVGQCGGWAGGAHCCFGPSSRSKRGLPWSGAQVGSTRRYAGVTQNGIATTCSRSVIADSF